MARTRQFDPERRERILAAALEVIAARGVAGLTYRAVAETAGVPLGSMTYHFPSREEMLHAAFSALADTMHARFDQILADLPPDADPLEGVLQIVAVQGGGYPSDMVLSLELYSLALREVRYRELIDSWMERSRRSLMRHFSAEVSPVVDALQEGLVLHSHISTQPFDLERVRAGVIALAGRQSRRPEPTTPRTTSRPTT